MDEKTMNEKVKEVKRTKKRKEIKRECAIILERQEEIRETIEELEEEMEKLIDSMLKAEDKDALALIKDKIAALKSRIEMLTKESKENVETLEVYGRVVKIDVDKVTSGINSGAKVLETVGSIGLGAWMGAKIYQTDLTSGLFNRGLKDFMMKLNPFHINSKN